MIRLARPLPLLLLAAIACGVDEEPPPPAPADAPTPPRLEVLFVDAAGETSRLVRWVEGEEGWSEVESSLPDASRGLAADPESGRLWIPSRGEDVLIAGSTGGGEWTRLPLAGLDSAYAVLHDPDDNVLYLSDYGRDEILRVDREGRAAEPIVGGLVAPRALALDGASRTLYWVDRGAGRVQSVPVPEVGEAPDPTAVRTLIDEGLPAPYGIAWDAREGVLYVADAELGSIFRLDPRGGPLQLEPFLPHAGTHPSFLAVDDETRTLYWTDNRDNVLRRAALDGGPIETLAEGLAGPRGLVLLRTLPTPPPQP